ncbi:type II secretory pathway pseudopilin PulG [Rummeliibacillus stabekisii]|nr:type II secretory pathway pseudopilin PulG [Rummeliibacillus stabekisii]GEL06133.1 hypothetical protein RST01_27600 [Rummeliibacillus stabekisii]
MSINKEQPTLIRSLFYVIQKPHLLVIGFTIIELNAVLIIIQISHHLNIV